MGEETVGLLIPLYLWKMVEGGGLALFASGWLVKNGLLLLAA